MADDKKNSKALIIIAVIGLVGTLGTAFITNWGNIFPSPTPPVPRPEPHPVQPIEPASIVGGPIIVTATANPNVLSSGQETAVRVYVQDSQGSPLPNAIVTLSSGGGQFKSTGTTSMSGSTNASGSFVGYWSCNPCAPGYVSGVRVTKKGYTEANTKWRVEIR